MLKKILLLIQIGTANCKNITVHLGDSLKKYGSQLTKDKPQLRDEKKPDET